MIEEPLPEPIIAREESAVSSGEFYTATQMHDYAARVTAAKDAEVTKWQAEYITATQEIARLMAEWGSTGMALAERDAEIGVLRKTFEIRIMDAQTVLDKYATKITTLRAAAQQALEWFEWVHGDKAQNAYLSTEVQDALTAALKGMTP